MLTQEHWMRRLWCAVARVIWVPLCVSMGAGLAHATSMDELRQQVEAASRIHPPWDGPTTGAPGQRGKKIALLCEDLRNGGILGVAEGVGEAAAVLQWQIRIFDARGTPAGRDKAAAAALAERPDGLIVIGADAEAIRQPLLNLQARRIPVVGWHVGPKAGPLPETPVAMNVSTDPLDVAHITAAATVIASAGRAGVVIFTDSNFAIATAKANAMAEVIRACKGCELLEVRDLAISNSAAQMPAVTRELLERYGTRWTHALAINDIYFDYATPALIAAGAGADRLKFLSAGDGSPAAFMRIATGTYQTATVAEPLSLHGWQLVDELNRLLARQPVSGYIAPVHLVTPENVGFDGGSQYRFDPDNDYRASYRRIWQR